MSRHSSTAPLSSSPTSFLTTSLPRAALFTSVRWLDSFFTARQGNPDTRFLLLPSQPTELCAVGMGYMFQSGSPQAHSTDVCSMDPTATRGPQASRHSRLDVIVLGRAHIQHCQRFPDDRLPSPPPSSALIK